MPDLVFKSGKYEGKRLPLPADKPITFGRQKGCTIVIDDAELSRRHCQFTFTGKALTVEDMGSLNKTFVNENAIEKKKALKHGDLVRFGPISIQISWVEQKNLDKTGLETASGVARRVASDPEDPQFWIGKTLGGYEVKKYRRTIVNGLFEYEGLQKLMKRQATLSVLLRDVAENSRIGDRFMRLAGTAGTLQHSNIAMVYDVGESEGCFYMVSEMVRGRTITQLIEEKGGALEPVVALDVAIQIADALTYLAKREIIHRDIQPDNLIINEDCTVKISNLWVTKSVGGPELTGENRVLGTLDFMSPEQTEDSGGVDHRTDLYGLGATLFYMLTGTAPYADTTNFVQKVRRIREEPVSELAAIKKRKLPKQVVPILTSAMQKSPLQRYQTAIEMKNALTNAKAALIKS